MTAHCFRTRFETTDFERAISELISSYSPHHLYLIDDDRPFHARHASDGFEGVSIYRLGYGANVRAETAPFSSYLLLSQVRRGRYRIKSSEGQRLLDIGDTVALDPYTAYSMEFLEDCELIQMRIGQNAWNRALSDLLGCDDPRYFRFSIAKRPEASYHDRCCALLNLVSSEVIPHNWTEQSPLLRSQVIRLCVSAILDNPMRSPASHIDGRVVSRNVRRALNYFEENCKEDISIVEVAKAAKVSTRSLQDAFQKELGITPMAALREMRMKQAYADLKRLSPHDTTVTEVALRWGFANLGRFSVEFRRRFDQHPSEVLRS
jgi:AraC-like DNA-binding protein